MQDHNHSETPSNLERAGKFEDIEERITILRQALELHPSGGDDGHILYQLSNSLQDRYAHTGKYKDIEEAIKHSRAALELCPSENPKRYLRLSSLSAALHARFQRTGNTTDFKEVILRDRESVKMAPVGSGALELNNLADSLAERFEHTGNTEDMEESIACNRKALALRPPGNVDRFYSLNYLAKSLLNRYSMMKRPEDLDEVINLSKEAIEVCPPNHRERYLALSGLADALKVRYEDTQRLRDLQDVIKLERESLAQSPPRHTGRPLNLSNLASSLNELYRREKNIKFLEEAILYSRESVTSCPMGHPNQSNALATLAESLYHQSKHTKDVKDLVVAIECLQTADDIIPPLDPSHNPLRCKLASLYLRLGELDSDRKDAPKAFELYENAVNQSTSSVKSRLTTAIKWATKARKHKHESVLRAFSTALRFLQRYLVANPTIELQQKLLATDRSRIKSLASDAAATAIEENNLETAVELLERGRAILWSRLRGYRHPLLDLRRENREFADEFERLSGQLERNATTSGPGSGNDPLESYDVQQQKHRILSEQWDNVVERIRKVPGFTDFLQAVPFNTLREAAAEGPIVVVNVSNQRCDVIIVRHVGDPVLVPLPKVSYTRLSRLSTQFSDPQAMSADKFAKQLVSNLKQLWDMIVQPVVEKLAELKVVKMSRVWWCPTSQACALPLHAAGLYQLGQPNFPDIYISSYTSTLSTLIESRVGVNPQNSYPQLLVVGQPDTELTDPKKRLPQVAEEVRRIQQLGPFVKTLIGEEATRQTVIPHLRDSSWVHFACHGYRNQQPFNSSFGLHNDERLTLLDLMKAKLPNAEHAFLSACHAAATDVEGAPDEVIHLAAALQFCGFRSVVGTLWAMADQDGPDVAQDFYRKMLRQPESVNFKDSAAALNYVTREMRKREGMTLGRWVNFVHIGA